MPLHRRPRAWRIAGTTAALTALWMLSVAPAHAVVGSRPAATAADAPAAGPGAAYQAPGTPSPSVAGATTPFITYQAPGATLGGGASVVSLTSPPTSQYDSPQGEASGHAYVQLTGTGQSVQWTNNTGQSDQNPADGDPRDFWDEFHAWISGAAIPPGATFSLEKDSSNTAQFYWINSIDLWNAPSPLAGQLSELRVYAAEER